MKHLLLQRGSPTRTECEGVMRFEDVTLRTMERPWIPSAPGGAPYESCVPAGIYRLVPHLRANGDKVVALVNHGLGVYHMRADRPNRCGRYLVLLHWANWVRELAGCIAPGMGRRDSTTGSMVTDSRKAMGLIMQYIGDDEAELEIVGANTYSVAT